MWIIFFPVLTTKRKKKSTGSQAIISDLFDADELPGGLLLPGLFFPFSAHLSVSLHS
jgi:hypothetical protein